MRFKRHFEFEKGQLDIAPLIDMVFQLLIFFMLTSSFIVQPGIKIDLPKAITSEAIHEQNLVIIIDAAGLVYMNNRQIKLTELKAQLKKAAGQKRPILIKADRKASLGRVVQIWDLCRETGLSQINIATNQPAEQQIRE